MKPEKLIAKATKIYKEAFIDGNVIKTDPIEALAILTIASLLAHYKEPRRNQTGVDLNPTAKKLEERKIRKRGHPKLFDHPEAEALANKMLLAHATYAAVVDALKERFGFEISDSAVQRYWKRPRRPAQDASQSSPSAPARTRSCRSALSPARSGRKGSGRKAP
jgi:hypothetical protein